MNNASYKIVNATNDTVFIIDLDIGKSITNDAEWVYDQVQKKHPGKRLVYRDTMKNWDEIVKHNDSCSFRVYRGPIPYCGD